jgi:endonuclease/exonuclease/phosphatase family metal-dependent hydrolase
MKILYFITCFIGFSFLLIAQSTSLRILSINVWSGLDYQGKIHFGEFESPERREIRFQALLAQARSLKPDVIFIQEANPVRLFASRFADSLNMDEIHNVSLAGIKFGMVGFPTNFKEGLIILGNPSLCLEKIDTWKLSGSFGFFGDAVTIHFDESNFALVGKILIHDTPAYLLNVHLSSEVPYDSLLLSNFKSFLSENGNLNIDSTSTLKRWGDESVHRKDQIEILLKELKEIPEEFPIIVGGDFNATNSSPEIKLFEDSGKFFNSFIIRDSTCAKDTTTNEYTWDHKTNENSRYSTTLTNLDGTQKDGYNLLNAFYDTYPRRIDHIYLNKCFKLDDILLSRIALDSAINNAHPSDHYGVVTDIDLKRILSSTSKISNKVSSLVESTFEPLPIFSYDTDAGFGYGAKAFFLNSLGSNESFDAVLFNSTKGERWYRFVFSIPDFEVRQGKVYPIALNLTVDYDKRIKNSFFGIGNNSRYEDREFYTSEPFEISLTFSKGFSQSLIGQIGLKYKNSRNYNFSDSSRLVSLLPTLNRSRMFFTSFTTLFMYDTRNSYINPSRGTVIKGEAEIASDWKLSNVSFVRGGIWLHHYSLLFDYPKTILAIRTGLQEISGHNVPVQTLLSMGGGNVLRGSPQDRYLDNVSALLNIELRFPIYWHFGGIIGYDAGKVWNKLSKLDMRRWSTNPVAGLRFYFDTFIVRLDLGFGKETTGFYLNFGHLF